MKGFHSRPTTDFAKEGLFNVLEHSFEIQGSQVLDLFSGTGNISYEFISRGALHVYSIDASYPAIQFVKKTSKLLGINTESHIKVKSDVIKYLKKTDDTFNIIFADPPYDYADYSELLKSIETKNMIKTQGLIIIEHFKKIDLSHLDGYQKSHLFGNVCFSFFNFGDNE